MSLLVGVIFPLFVIFVAKTIDNVLGVSKTILVQRNKRLSASIALTISNFIAYIVTKSIVKDDGMLSMAVASVACGVGCFIAMSISDKLSRDRLYVNTIMSDNREAMQNLRNFLAEHHITNVAHESFTKDWEKTITITVYAETKAESRLLDDYLEATGLKFKRHIITE